MRHDPSPRELLDRGAAGDTTLDLTLSAREAAAAQVLISLAATTGLLPAAHAWAESDGLGEAWWIAFRAFQAKLGIRLARALDVRDLPDYERLVADLAGIDAEAAAWRAGDSS